jgi:hypothetical protein
MRWWLGPLCTRPILFSWIFIVLVHWYNSTRVDMSPHSNTLSDFFDTRWLSGISSTIFYLFLQNGQVVVALCRLIGIEQILMHLSFHHATSIIITSLDIYGSFCWCEMKNKNKINVRENRKGNQEWTIQTLEHTRHTVRTKTNKTKITTQK